MAESMIRPVRVYYVDPATLRRPADPVITKEERDSWNAAIRARYDKQRDHRRKQTTELAECRICGEMFERYIIGRPATMCHACRKIPKDKREERRR